MKATQKAKILAYCAEHGSITVRDAVVRLGINSPRKRISEMRSSELYDVQDITETVVDELNLPVRYKRYFISKVGESIG